MSSMANISRDPDDYTLTTHAEEQVIDRDIPVHSIKKAIREGERDDEFAHEDHQTSFILEFPGPDLILIIDTSNNNIVSVYFDDEQGADEGSLGGRKFGNIGSRLKSLSVLQ